MLLKVLLARQPLAAHLALERRPVGVVHAGVALEQRRALEALPAHRALVGLVLRVGQQVVLHVALVGELALADGAGEGFLLVLPHVVRDVLPALEALVAHLAGVGHHRLPPLGGRAPHAVVLLRRRARGRRGCGPDRVVVVVVVVGLQVVAEELDVLRPQPAFVAIEHQHEVGRVRWAFSRHQVSAADDALVVEVSADSLLVHGAAQLFHSPQAVVEVRASLMPGQHVGVESVVCGERLGANVALEHGVRVLSDVPLPRRPAHEPRPADFTDVRLDSLVSRQVRLQALVRF